jgi:hypothetical protein
VRKLCLGICCSDILGLSQHCSSLREFSSTKRLIGASLMLQHFSRHTVNTSLIVNLNTSSLSPGVVSSNRASASNCILRIRVQFCTFFTNLGAAKLLCDFLLETVDGLELLSSNGRVCISIAIPLFENPLTSQFVD